MTKPSGFDQVSPLVTPTDSSTEDWRQATYESVLTPAPAGPFYESALAPTSVAAPAALPIEELGPATRRGLAVLSVALGAGVTGNWLLRATPWGLNLVVWLALTVGATWWLARHDALARRKLRWFWVPLGVFALAFAWRDSLTLQALDALALLVTLLTLALSTQRGRLLTAGLMEYVMLGLVMASETMIGMLMLIFGDIRWSALPRDGWSRQALAIAKGVAVAVPLLCIFGGLLMAADAVFENLVMRAFAFDVNAIILHLFFTGSLAWLVGGYLHGLLMSSSMGAPGKTSTGAQPVFFQLGLIETSIVLGTLNLLFLAFVAIQFRYLFFGAVDFPVGAGTAYANYARRGFFELVWVSLLVLPLLLGMHWVLRKDEPRNERLFRWLAGTQIVLLFVIMASAVQRMRLYHDCCGLTELRVYTMAFMGWLALVFVWFGLTVLRGRRERFAFGATLAGLGVIAALHLINPDHLIARVNLSRARAGLPLDVAYTTSLSADSVPALVEGLAGLPPVEQAQIRQRLLTRDWSGGATGWRSWNWSRVKAYKLVSVLPR